MPYLSIEVEVNPGEPFQVQLPDRSGKKSFDSIGAILEWQAAQGWNFVDSLPQIWRFQSDWPPGQALVCGEIKGLVLLWFTLIFRRDE